MRKTLKLILVLTALLTLPWLTSIAYGNNNDISTSRVIRIEAADQAVAPAATFFGSTTGSVSSGDLFYIDATSTSHDLTASLYITNTPELISYLKYLILKISVYSKNKEGGWQRTVLSDYSDANSNIYLTLRNSPIFINLRGNCSYKVSIDSGSYYCFPSRVGSSKEPPLFYLAIEPA